MKQEAIGHYLQEAFYWEDEQENVLQTLLWERNTKNIRMSSTEFTFWLVHFIGFSKENTLSGT